MAKPNRLRENWRMRAAPWKSGPSGPRKAFRISAAFSRRGNDLSRRRVFFPQPAKPEYASLKVVAAFNTVEERPFRAAKAVPNQCGF